MYPDRYGNRQRGAGLPIAIFIITVLALIVTSMAQQQEATGAAVSQQILSQRAFYAAESGAQAAVTEALHGPSGCGSVPASLSFTQAGLANCSAGLSCSSVQADIEGSPALETVYTLVSTSQCGGGAEAASRAVEVRVR
jgi:MSHA biogenesis protein MshP